MPFSPRENGNHISIENNSLSIFHNVPDSTTTQNRRVVDDDYFRLLMLLIKWGDVWRLLWNKKMKFLYLRFLSPQQGGNIPQLHTIKANPESHLRLARRWRQFLSCFMFLYHMFYLLPMLEYWLRPQRKRK